MTELIQLSSSDRSPSRRAAVDLGGLFRHYVPQAGHPGWPQLLQRAKAQARVLRPLLERPQQGPARWRRQARSWATAAANYRENRSRAAAGRQDWLPLYFIWTLLRPCNFRCSYCDDHRGARYPELTADGTLTMAQGKRLLEVMRTRTPSVYFAGGEPTMSKNLPALVRAARDLDYYPIAINTNGSLFDRLLERSSWQSLLADVDVIVVSLDALHLNTLRRMWGTARPERVLGNLLLLRELRAEMNFKLMVNTVIQPTLMDEALAVLDLAQDLDIGFCPVPRNVGARIDPQLLQDPAYCALVKAILERQRAGAPVVGSRRMNERLLRAAPLNCRNTLKPHVDFDGHLFWPCKASCNVAPARIRVLDFKDVDALYAHAVTQLEPTRFHGPARNQCGGDCNWAQNYTTDEYAFGLQSPWHLLGAMRRFASS